MNEAQLPAAVIQLLHLSGLVTGLVTECLKLCMLCVTLQRLLHKPHKRRHKLPTGCHGKNWHAACHGKYGKRKAAYIAG